MGSLGLRTSTDQLQIGGDSLNGNQYFAGTIDEVRVYNVALTPLQIQSDMNRPIGTGALMDTQPPTAPTNLAATASGNQVNLSWTASTDNVGVTGYLVYRENPGSTTFVQVGTATGTTFTDASLPALGTYTYEVQATDAAGNISPDSSAAAP